MLTVLVSLHLCYSQDCASIIDQCLQRWSRAHCLKLQNAIQILLKYFPNPELQALIHVSTLCEKVDGDVIFKCSCTMYKDNFCVIQKWAVLQILSHIIILVLEFVFVLLLESLNTLLHECTHKYNR